MASLVPNSLKINSAWHPTKMGRICHEHCRGVDNEYYSIAYTDNILKDYKYMQNRFIYNFE
jgi:hypothetical protein